MNLLEILHRTIKNKKTVMLYGAGDNTRNSINRLKEYFNIIGIWDKALYGTDVCGYKVEIPFRLSGDIRPAIILITIKDDLIRDIVSTDLNDSGYDRVFFSDTIIRIIDEMERLGCDIRQVDENGLNSYEYIYNPLEPVNYSVVEPGNGFRIVSPANRAVKEIADRLRECLILEGEKVDNALKSFFDTTTDPNANFYVLYEALLRQLLAGGVKTKYRPIRMVGDIPYDSFSTYEAQRIIIKAICRNNAREAVNLTDELIRRSFTNKYLKAVKAVLLLEEEEYDHALRNIRELAKDNPADFLVNEIYYVVVRRCKEAGIEVKEPIPPADLLERYCWSGLTFAWIGGFDKDEKPIIAPCFRAIECAARPKGDFCDSEEWGLFRKSILDGSFRYCQKMQCTNIVGGWLPEKKKCNHPVASNLIGDSSSPVLLPEEIHLSYDRHCNLSCPSCRTSFCMYGKNEAERFNRLYDEELRPLIENAKHLCLSGSGEALLSPHSKRILMDLPKYAQPDLKVELRTNMTVLDKATWESLEEGRRFIRHIAASIDSCSKELFETLRFPAKWETVKKNLADVRELRQAGEIDLFEFHVVVQDANVDELLGIAEMAMEYDADAVTYSKIVNWQGMSRNQYERMNPFYVDHPKHKNLMNEIDRLKKLRSEICNGNNKMRKTFYINIHFEDDPDETYYSIRYGELKIR